MYTLKAQLTDINNRLGILHSKGKDVLSFKGKVNETIYTYTGVISFINEHASKYLKQYSFIQEIDTPQTLIGDYAYSRRQFRLDTWPIYVFLVLAFICFTNSAVFHLFSAYGEKANAFFSRLDYAGIALLITGSCIPPYYYLYYCNSFYRNIYMVFISSCSIMVFICTLTPKFNRPMFRRFRGLLFLTLGLSAASPLIHLFFFYNPKIGMIDDPILFFWIGGGLCYIGGVGIYLSRFPEKKCPGKFDYCGASHQIWHSLVILGMITHYYGCLGSYYDRVLHECPAV